MKKRILVSVLVVIALLFGGVVYVKAAGIGPFSVEVGPVEIVEPISTILTSDSPPLPPTGAKLEPGDSFTIKVAVYNNSTKRGYWVAVGGVGWGGEDTQNLLVQVTAIYEGKILSSLLYIPAGATKTVEITVKIRENSPAVKGVTFHFSPPTRVELQEKG